MNFKRISLIILSIILALSLFGCKPKNSPKSQGNSTSITTTTTETKAKSGNAKSKETTTKSTTTEKATTSKTTTAKATTTTTKKSKTTTVASSIKENGVYDQKDDVALYIKTYGHLPSNYITKKQAENLGWTGGSLDKYAKGKCIGGDKFGNYEGILPKKNGRTYTECDIDTLGAKSRGAKRIVYSSDGLIYYTDDHYKTFTLLYGEE